MVVGGFTEGWGEREGELEDDLAAGGGLVEGSEVDGFAEEVEVVEEEVVVAGDALRWGCF